MTPRAGRPRGGAHDAGGVFGEMSLLTGDPRTATVAAVATACCSRSTPSRFARAALEHPAAVEAISLLVVARRAGLDRARALAEEERAALRVESHTLLGRIRHFLRLPAAGPQPA